ncbi:hypothetical protein MANES_02G192750v8 [Manihot esculenta]|uniref:Uncharacterized protein n=1 Tax=Manihot esculenta TaxID=3983 RepID=A0ACB7I7D7_MANES|nr:hypothetical protein MANES_02G192750v8 [Manihot esculenta]
MKNKLRRVYLLKCLCQSHSHKFLQRKNERLREHVRDHNSDHNRCSLACQDLMNQAQHIEESISKQSEKSKIECCCLAFRGNDEYEGSLNKEKFIELLKVLASFNEKINNVALKNAPENLKLIAPSIQKDIINICVVETTNVIIRDVEDDLFSILQMGVVIRYVNKFGCVVERFLGIVHINDTSASSLKKTIESLFSTHGEFNGLKSLILRENSSVCYIHCFAHQLQLTLIAIAKKHSNISIFFYIVARLCNIVGGS